MTDPQPQQPRERESAADAARTEAARTAASTLVQLGLIVGISLAMQHHRVITARARHLLARAGRRGPSDAGLQEAEFAARVSAWDHGERT